MTTSVDVYSQTNPAFLGVVLHEFALGYHKASDKYPSYVLMYLPCPIAVSKKLARTMEGTNATTGLAKWYLKSPELQINVVNEVRRSVTFTRRALQYALLSNVFEMRDSTLVPLDGAFKKKPKDPTGRRIEDRPYTAANRLGQWCGQVDSAERIFALLGLRP
ncbi:MAG: three component ABC system middle component [Fuerstiella sp.]